MSDSCWFRLKAEVAEAQSRAQSLEAEAAAAKKACEEAVAAADAATRGEAEQITQSVTFALSLQSQFVVVLSIPPFSSVHIIIIIIKQSRIDFYFSPNDLWLTHVGSG